MGYSTDFYGTIKIVPAITDELKSYINSFSSVRHMDRDVEKIKEIDPDWEKHCYKGNLGEGGQYYIPTDPVKGSAISQDMPFFRKPTDADLNPLFSAPNPDDLIPNPGGQVPDKSIKDFNHPAKDVPGLWCQWIINDNGDLEWDGGEKFYGYVLWLKYLIENFFKPEGYTLEGEIEYQGEDEDDKGRICVDNNDVKLRSLHETTTKVTKTTTTKTTKITKTHFSFWGLWKL